MSTYEKPAVLPAWGETNTTAADMVQPPAGELSTGWPLSATPPPRQYFNWLLNWLASGLRYYCQRGLPDWDAAETYQTGATIIGDDGQVYRSLVNANVNQRPSATPNAWALFTSGAGGLTIQAVEAAQLTQPAPAQGDNSGRVPTTSWVNTAVNIASQAVSTALTNVTNGLQAALTALTTRVTALEGEQAGSSSVVTGQRQFGTTYQNTTVRPMLVMATGQIGGSYSQGFGIGGYTGQQNTAETLVAVSAVHNDQGITTVVFAVPAGWYYNVQVYNNNVSNPQNPQLTSWVECSL